MNKGQMSIGAMIGMGISIFIPTVLASVGIIERKVVRVDEDITQLRSADYETIERVAKLEEAISTIKSDTSTIKSDIKTLLRSSQ